MRWPRVRVVGSAALAPLLALVLLGGAPAALAAPSDGDHTAARPAAGDAAPGLKRRAVDEGSVRVLITLAVDFRAEGDLPPAAVANQRGSIARARAGLLRDLRGTEHRVHRVFDAVPVVAAQLSAEALDAARRSVHVLAIDEDIAVEPALATTDTIVEGHVARSAGYDGAGRMVAILDTGVDAGHAFFGGRVVEEACFSNRGVAGSGSLCPGGAASAIGPGSAAPCASSACAHGTHVAGIAAGASTTMSGVAAAADVMAIQVFSQFDTGVASWSSDWMAALDYVYSRRASHDIAAANLSLGSDSFRFDCDHHPAKTVIDNLRSVGIATVIAAGNSHLTHGVAFPACVSSAVTVGATTDADAPATFTNAHPTLVDLLAPGDGVESAVPGGGYSILSGTSMAAPQVAGALAVAGHRFGGAAVETLTRVLQDTGMPVTDSRGTAAEHHSQPRIRLGPVITGTDRLVVEAAGRGRGTISSSDGLIACGPRCSAATAGGTVTLSAAPFAGSGFAGWSGACTGTGTCTVAPSGLAHVVATFTASATGNDAFAGATSVGSLPFERRQSTAGATVEHGEPAPSACDPVGTTVWHRYTPAVAGDVVVRTHGSSFDVVVAVYRGTSVSGLTLLGCDGGTRQYGYRDALVTFAAEAGQTYMIQVGSYGGGSGGDLLLRLHEPLRPPAAPSGVTADPSDAAATVGWQPSPTTAGTPIAGYAAFSSRDAQLARVPAHSRSGTVTGLTNGQAYSFRVVSQSAGGYSPVSASSAEVVPTGPPDPPAGVSAVPGDGQATVAWSRPDNDGGYPLTGYTVTSSPGGHAVEVADPDVTTASVAGLANGEAYTFTVVAHNSAGASEASAASAPVVPAGRPDAPSGVTAAPGDGRATVSWTAPNARGSVLTGYTVTTVPGGVAQPVAGSATSAVVSGLENGTAYTFTVVAHNAEGDSDPSESSEPVTPAHVPAPPSQVIATPGDERITVAWSAPASDGGSPITGYVVTVSPGERTEVTGAAVRELEVGDLKRGTAYAFHVQARNVIGLSEPSDPSPAVEPQSRPGPPTAVSASHGDGRITVRWQPPADDGGLDLTGYVVSWDDGAGHRGQRTVDPTVREATIDGLRNGREHSVAVVARNPHGDSTAATATATPMSPSSSPSPSPSPSPSDPATQEPAPEPAEPGVPTDEGVEPGIERLAGTNRFATAAAISRDAFAPGVPVVYVATGGNYPDALAGGAAAALRGGPVLLVTRDGVPSDTAVELARLRPAEIVVLGGAGAVSEAVASSLRAHAPVRRLAGPDRFATAAGISRDAFPAGVPVAYVATGGNYPDALAGGAAAGSRGGPVLLVTRDGVPRDTATELARLRPGEIVVLGGAGAVSDAVSEQLEEHAPVRRLRGGDRFATAASVAADAFPAADAVYIATGGNYPDALAGSTTAAIAGGPVLLVHGAVPEPVAAELARLRPRRIVVLGGKGAVSDAVVDALHPYLRAP